MRTEGPCSWCSARRRVLLRRLPFGFLILFLPLLLLPARVLAQDGAISGTVKDAATSTGLATVEVSVLSADGAVVGGRSVRIDQKKARRRRAFSFPHSLVRSTGSNRSFPAEAARIVAGTPSFCLRLRVRPARPERAPAAMAFVTSKSEAHHAH